MFTSPYLSKNSVYHHLDRPGSKAKGTGLPLGPVTFGTAGSPAPNTELTDGSASAVVSTSYNFSILSLCCLIPSNSFCKALPIAESGSSS